ncbi:MAG: ATP-binding protein [Acidobacteriaceae bacterium]|nr:ATP-binding protein [Acidobacteriaceae bacterium]
MSYYLHGCPCGFHGDPTRECRCTPGIIQRYLAEIFRPCRTKIFAGPMRLPVAGDN